MKRNARGEPLCSSLRRNGFNRFHMNPLGIGVKLAADLDRLAFERGCARRIIKLVDRSGRILQEVLLAVFNDRSGKSG